MRLVRILRTVTMWLILAGAGSWAVAQLTVSDLESLEARKVKEGWTFTVGTNGATQRALKDLCGTVAPGYLTNANVVSEMSSAAFPASLPAGSLPSAFDWRSQTGLPPIRDQGGCGSCWAFSTVGTMECGIRIKDGVDQDLSEQWLVSCNRDGWSCSGGWYEFRMFLHTDAGDSSGGNGAVMESDDPYQSANGTCSGPYPHHYWMTSWGNSGDSVDQIKQAIITYGPVSTTVNATSAFQGYTGGIFNEFASGSINHAIVLVGWNDNGTNGYWILRNSWGSWWGESGYMRIAYNCNTVGYNTAWGDYESGRPDISVASTAIVSESCLPTNGAIDPGEIVTANVALRNTGRSDTSNLVVTLQATDGITSFSGPQTYGLLSTNGLAVVRPFTFSVTNAFGSTVLIPLQLQDGTNTYGTVNASFVIGSFSASFTEAFDRVTAPALPAGWTTSATGGQSAWVTSTGAKDTSPNSAFATDAASVGLTELVSPAVPIVGVGAQLSFRHSYATESGYDGGVLDIKIGAGSFGDILSSGGVMVAGGYNGTISSSYSNPLSGRSAWTGNSGGFVTTTVRLPSSAAGQSVQFRWRCGSDSSVSATGWYVDTVSLADLVARNRAVVTDVTNLTMSEGSSATFHICLPDQPSSVTTVTVARISGDTGITVTNGNMVVFGTNEWASLKSVTVASAKDANWSNQQAIVRCSAPGYLASDMVVTGVDYDCSIPVGVDASDGLLKDGVRVSWTSAANAAWYEVWRHTTAASGAAVRVAGGVAGTSWLDTTAAAGTNYYYWVKSANVACTSDFSAVDTGYIWPGYLTWGYKAQLRITGYNRAEALTNFPVLILIGTNVPGFAYAQMAAPMNAGDLRFTDEGERTLLNYEPDAWATGSVSTVWVQVPVLTNNASVWMYWGNPSRTAPLACTTNGAVWDDTFRGVWHLSEASGTLLDSTRNRNNGTRTGTTAGPGEIGGAQVFNSAGSQQIDCGNGASLQSFTNLTLSMWVKPTALTGERGLASKWSGTWCWVLNHDGTDVAGRQGLWFNGWKTAATAVSTGRWSHVAVSYSQGEGAMAFYLNGQPDGTAAQATGPATGANLRFGTRQDGGTSYFDGSMDEIRVESVKRSSNWVWACYLNIISNGMFISTSTPVTNQMTLTVTSVTTSAPAAGVYSFAYGSVVTSRVSSVVYEGPVRYNLQKWTMTPCEGIPLSVAGAGATNVVLVMTNDTGLTWAWTLYNQFAATKTDGGRLSLTSGWYQAWQSVIVTATASNYYHFGGWTGDVAPGQVTSNPVTVVMNQPRAVRAAFVEDQVTSGTPLWWLAQYGWTNNPDAWSLADSDGDGMTNWQEEAAGTDPTNWSSKLTVTNAVLGAVGGGQVVSWPSVPGRVYGIERCSELVSCGFISIVSNVPAMPPVNVYTDSFSGTRVFYRVKVSKAP